MCTANATNMNQNSSNTNNKNQASPNNMYPDLAQFQAEQTIMNLLEALGLVPPGSQYNPSAPQEASSSGAAAGAQETPGANTAAAQGPAPSVPSMQDPRNPSAIHETTTTNAGFSGVPSTQQSSTNNNCPNCCGGTQQQQPQPQQQQQQQQQQQGCNWNWSWPNHDQPSRHYSNQRINQQCNFVLPRFFRNLGQTITRVFRCTTKISSLFFLIFMFQLLVPSFFVKMVVFALLANIVGLHMPTLVAGAVMYTGVNMFVHVMLQPVILPALLFFAVHKTVVRGEPLLDRNFWLTRLEDLKRVAAEIRAI